MTELLIGTRKGLFVAEGDPGDTFTVTTRAFVDDSVEHAVRDPRTGRVIASVTPAEGTAQLWYADDPSGGWEQARGLDLPDGSDAELARIWVLTTGEAEGTLYAGGDPGVLFESHDGGATWALNRSLWENPTRASWRAGGGGLCLHSIATWPGEPARLAVAISAAGVWLTDDGGASWRPGNAGLPDASGAPCVHRLLRARQRPERLFMQFHGGVFRSDDAGASWLDVSEGLPSDFGFPLALDAEDPDAAYVIPLAADDDRVTPDGRVRVYETRDAGASWTARTDGLPQEQAYLTVLREAFDSHGAGAALELYFGATSGDVFASADGGATWSSAAAHLPPVLAITASPGAAPASD